MSSSNYRTIGDSLYELDDKGKPVYREDGKVLKSDNYKEPNLSDLLESYAYALGGHIGNTAYRPDGFVLGGIFKDIEEKAWQWRKISYNGMTI